MGQTYVKTYNEARITYTLDSQGRVISISDSYYDGMGEETYVTDYEVRWNEDEMNFYQLQEGAEDEWIQTRKYNEFQCGESGVREHPFPV